MLTLILIAIVAVIGVILAVKLLSNVLKVVAIVVLLLLMVLVVGGFFVVRDASRIGNAIAHNEVAYVLVSDGKPVTAFTITGLNQSSFAALPLTDLDEFGEEDRYLFEVNESFILAVDEGLLAQQGFLMLHDESYETQAQGFMLLYLYQAKTRGPFFFFEGLRSGEIAVEPSSLTIALLQKAPKTLINDAKERVQVKIEEGLRSDNDTMNGDAATA